MARIPKDKFLPGAHNVICDRTGFKKKSTQVKREWNNSVVRRGSFEHRHPQDFVRAVRDDQTVPDPRPGAADIPLAVTTTLDGDEVAGQTTLSVAATTNFAAGDTIIIDLDNDEKHLASISSFVAGDTVTVDTQLPSKASSGNTVTVFTSTVSL